MKRLHLFTLIIFCTFAACKQEKSDTTDTNADTETSEIMNNVLTDAEIADGWRLLFDGKTTDQWRGYNRDTFPNGWSADGTDLIVTSGGGDIITKEEFDNFELTLDFKLVDTANSGIFYLAIEEEGTPIWNNAPEYQILDNKTYISIDGLATHRTHLTGDNYDIHAASEDFSKPVGEWSTAKIVHNNGKVEHWLNGHMTVSYEIGSDAWEELVKASKFKDYPKYARATSGHIGLQDHGYEVRFKNIKVREL